MRLRTKLAALAVAGGVALSATAAYAYWTAGGAGGGSNTVAGSNGSVQITAAVPSGIVPGGSVNVPVSAKTSAATDLFITSFNAPVITASGTCAASYFHLDMTGVNNGVVANGSTPTSLGTAVLSMDNDLANSQDNCKNATVSIALTSN